VELLASRKKAVSRGGVAHPPVVYTKNMNATGERKASLRRGLVLKETGHIGKDESGAVYLLYHKTKCRRSTKVMSGGTGRRVGRTWANHAR